MRCQHDIIFRDLARDHVDTAALTTMRTMIADLAARGAEGVVLGCTELAMLLPADGEELPCRVWDSAEVHSEAGVDFAFGGEGAAEETLRGFPPPLAEMGLSTSPDDP